MWMTSVKLETSSNSYYTPQSYGVLLRQTRGLYVTHPPEVNHELLTAVQKINVEVAFTMVTETTDMIFSSLKPNQTELVLQDGSQYQIVESLAEISKGASNKIKKFQYACIVKREKIILVWHDDIQMIFTHGQDVEKKLLALVCRFMRTFGFD
jgi:hypothetical protein